MRRKEYAVVTTGMRRIEQPAPLRLTRRGRVVVLSFFILLASLASAVLWTTASRAEERPTGPAPTVVVDANDTLWDIAARTAPGRSPHDVVAEIRRLNGLGSDDIAIHVGDTLVVPRPR
jgi:hypothetical protein